MRNKIGNPARIVKSPLPGLLNMIVIPLELVDPKNIAWREPVTEPMWLCSPDLLPDMWGTTVWPDDWIEPFANPSDEEVDEMLKCSLTS